MKGTKAQKGITLVALIITIVVLLILAVVAIGVVQDSNIIAHAQNAAGRYNQAKINELGALTEYEETLNKYVPRGSNTEFKGKKTYEGDTITISVTDDYIVSIYTINGTLLYDSLQAEKIPAPEGVQNPNEYADFFQITVGSETMIAAFSSDYSIIYTEDDTCYLMYENPVIYKGKYFGVVDEYILITSEGYCEAVSIISTEGGILKRFKIIECNNLNEISGYENYDIVSFSSGGGDKYEGEYSKVMISSTGVPSAIYNEQDNVWLTMMIGNTGFGIYDQQENWKTLDEDITREHIMDLLEASNNSKE